MTSSRAQNVSVFQNPVKERWKLPITAFSDPGGSLLSLPRNNTCTGKNTSASEKSSSGQQRSFKNSSTGPYGNYDQNKDYGFTSTSPNALMTNTVNSSSILNHSMTRRELSPVRWCDRKVDGVYLGRSGWVQVQQRSLDDGKGVVYSENNVFSTLPSGKHFPKAHSTRNVGGKCNRPINLPLPLKKRTIRETFERPSKFVQEFESVSPPSVTPIISPPPAFKDDGSNVDFPNRSMRKPFYSDELFLMRPEGSSCPSKGERRNNSRSFSSAISPGSTESSIPALKQDRFPYRTLKTKSLEDDSSNAMRCKGRRYDSAEPFTIFGFHSLDNDTRTGGNSAVKVNESDSFYVANVDTPKEKIMCNECDNEDVDDNRSNDSANSKECFSGSQNLSKEGPNGQRNSLKDFRQRNYLRNGRRTPNSHRTRSSSSDSRSSSSSSGFSGKSSEKLVSSRGSSSKEKQIFEFENPGSRDRKQFYVKRSRSLQLSEKRFPNDASIATSNSSSGKSGWDPMPPECSTSVQTKNQNGERSAPEFPQRLHHVLVTVSGDSIPVGTSGHQSLNSLNKITTSEEEQRKLITEAEKEARIISEFLNGTRSRAAARNLLMHRYLNKHEDGSSMESSENSPPKTERDVYFLGTDRRFQNSPDFWKDSNYDRGSFCKKKKSSNLCVRQQPAMLFNSKPFASFFRASNISGRTGSVSSFQNGEERKKKDRAENKGSREVYSAAFSNHWGKDHSSNAKVKSESGDGFRDENVTNSTVEKPPHLLLWKQKQKTRNDVLAGDPEAGKSSFKNPSQVLSPRTGMEDPRRFVESSSPSSSSSADICQVDFNKKPKRRTKTADSCDPFEVENNPETLLEEITFELGSAPGSDDSIAAPVDQRSLSLPRSFLSERHRLNDSDSRDLLLWKQQDAETLDQVTDEFPVNSQRSRTAPTTPTRDLRRAKSPENSNRIQCTGSPRASPSDEPPFLNSRGIDEKVRREKDEHSNEGSSPQFLIYKNLLQISENSTETVLQKLRKKFSLRYLKAKENFQDFDKSVDEEIESESGRNSSEVNPVARRLISDFQTAEIDDQVSEKALRFAKRPSAPKKGPKNEKYDSHDSGIQMGNRGNVDSSESQDTDFLEDVDSPLAARRRGIRVGDNFCRPESETSDRGLTAKLKADVQLLTKIEKRQKGVRRTNSDVGCQKLLGRGAKNPGTRFASYPAPIKDRHAKIVWKLPSPEDAAVSGKFVESQLRRSSSQPLGLNEMPAFSRSSILKCFALSEDEKNQRGKNSEDEFLSDSESSVASLLEGKKSFDFASREEAAILAEAVWDHVAIESFELPFRAGDVIEVLDTQNWDWWWGATAENRGYFPSAFVRLRVNQEDTVEDCLAAALAKGNNGSNRLRKGKTVSLLSNDQVRSSVVRELLNTERDFVKILRDIKDGYVEQCRRRTDMFSAAQITTIFSNLEDLLIFQEKFLKDLETKVDREFPFKSCIGQVFLIHGSGFRMYSEYCNSHPMAIATLQDLYRNSSYCKFFETCRLKQSLIEIPLHGYLLTPVQRICKYPLQLAELLKYTKPDHPDFKEVEEALETMRTVATLINERKRKMESLEKLAAWQQRVEGWEGEDLIEISSQLIHQGDVVRITSGVWTSNVTLFLFDHQIVYCKKDLLKRNVYIYKGRIFLDASIVVDVPDGKHQHLGVTVKYGLKICSDLKDKWLLFCCRSSEDKAKWLEALAEEKRLVAQDKEVGLDLPQAAKRLAKMAARTKKCPPCKPRGKNKIASNHEEMPFRNCHPGVSKTKSSRRMGNWFTFSGVIKNSKANPRPRTSLHRIT